MCVYVLLMLMLMCVVVVVVVVFAFVKEGRKIKVTYIVKPRSQPLAVSSIHCWHFPMRERANAIHQSEQKPPTDRPSHTNTQGKKNGKPTRESHQYRATSKQPQSHLTQTPKHPKETYRENAQRCLYVGVSRDSLKLPLVCAAGGGRTLSSHRERHQWHIPLLGPRSNLCAELTLQSDQTLLAGVIAARVQREAFGGQLGQTALRLQRGVGSDLCRLRNQRDQW
jgi:hypothetical protein